MGKIKPFIHLILLIYITGCICHWLIRGKLDTENLFWYDNLSSVNMIYPCSTNKTIVHLSFHVYWWCRCHVTPNRCKSKATSTLDLTSSRHIAYRIRHVKPRRCENCGVDVRQNFDVASVLRKLRRNLKVGRIDDPFLSNAQKGIINRAGFCSGSLIKNVDLLFYLRRERMKTNVLRRLHSLDLQDSQELEGRTSTCIGRKTFLKSWTSNWFLRTQ